MVVTANCRGIKNKKSEQRFCISWNHVAETNTVQFKENTHRWGVGDSAAT
jgi:hypothetical protein